MHCSLYQVYHYRNYRFWMNVSMHIMHNETSSLFQKHKVKLIWFSKMKFPLFHWDCCTYFFLRKHRRNPVDTNPVMLKSSKITRTICSDSHFIKISSAQLTAIIDTTTACTITPNTTNCIDPEIIKHIRILITRKEGFCDENGCYHDDYLISEIVSL